jgi:hypothetical protein
VALWSGHERLRLAVGVVSRFMLGSVVLATIVIAFIDLETAANFADVVSVITLLSLSGTLSTSRRADPPARADVEPSPSEPQASDTEPPSSPPPPTAAPSMRQSARWLRWQGLIIRAGAVLAFAITPDTDTADPDTVDPGGGNSSQTRIRE